MADFAVKYMPKNKFKWICMADFAVKYIPRDKINNVPSYDRT